MPKKSLQLCGFTLIAGIFGAFLRWLQNLNAFEADTGLQIQGSLSSLALAAYLFLFALLLLIFVRRQKCLCFSLSYPAVYAAPPPLSAVLFLAVGILIGLGGLVTIYRAIAVSRKLFDLLLGLSSLLMAVCAWLFLQGTGRKNVQKQANFLISALVFCLCFWLIAAYKYSSSDPVLWHFAPRLLAVAASILALYFVAGFVFFRPAPLSTLYFSLMAAFLNLVVLADDYPFGEQLITVGVALLCLCLAYAQLGAAKEKNSKT